MLTMLVITTHPYLDHFDRHFKPLWKDLPLVHRPETALSERQLAPVRTPTDRDVGRIQEESASQVRCGMDTRRGSFKGLGRWRKQHVIMGLPTLNDPWPKKICLIEWWHITSLTVMDLDRLLQWHSIVHIVRV